MSVADFVRHLESASLPGIHSHPHYREGEFSAKTLVAYQLKARSCIMATELLLYATILLPGLRVTPHFLNRLHRNRAIASALPR